MSQHISDVTRRNIIDLLSLRDRPFHGRLELVPFLERIWNIREMESTDNRFSDAAGDIQQHMVNNYDWTDEYLLITRLNVLHYGDDIFLNFLEQAVHPLVQSDQEYVSRLVADINEHLLQDSYRLELGQYLSGHATFVGRSVEPVGHEVGGRYDVALSFAGADRWYAEAVAAYVKARGARVFYDRYETATLWGRDLFEHFSWVYSSAARYCVIFVSDAYAESIWTTHERRSAQERALRERGEYILPLRFDDTVLPGLRDTVAYLSAKELGPEAVGDLILEKLRQSSPRSD